MAKKRKKASKRSWQGQLFLVLAVIIGVMLLPSTFLLMIGMVPTMVAGFVDRSKRGAKVLTVGSMNLSGCSPFLFDLWMQGHTFDTSMKIALNPQAIIVMYSAAGVGYLLDWAMTGVVSKIMVQRGEARARVIREQQQQLIERWGRKVTGELQLDPQGFPVDTLESAQAPKKEPEKG
jgi:hypothetical protein